MHNMKKMSKNKIVRFKKICKLASDYFSIRVISLFIHQKRFDENKKFNFPAKIYEIRKLLGKQNSNFEIVEIFKLCIIRKALKCVRK